MELPRHENYFHALYQQQNVLSHTSIAQEGYFVHQALLQIGTRQPINMDVRNRHGSYQIVEGPL